MPSAGLDVTSLALGGPPTLAYGRTAADVPTLLLRGDSAAVVSASSFESFGLASFRNTSLSVSKLIGPIAWAFGAKTFGDGDYRESTGHVALSTYLTRNVAVGIAGEVTETRIRLLRRDRSLVGSLRASVGVHAQRMGIDVGVRRLDTFWGGARDPARSRAYVATGHWLAGEFVDIVASTERRRGGRWSSAIGAVVAAHERVLILMARTTDPAGFAGGIEVTLPHLRAAYGVRTHRDLDATHVVTLSTIW